MRFIHTADWHLGNNFHDIDRTAEAHAFLEWLKDTITEYKAQSLIVAGDIFDTANPPVWARRLYFSFLASLIDTPCRNVVITGGNHDSGALLDAPSEVLAHLNITVVGSMAQRTAADCVVPLREGGKLIGVCAAIPYMREAELRSFDASFNDVNADGTGEVGTNGGFLQRTLTRLYGKAAEVAQGMMSGERVPFIVTGHLFATGLEGRYAAGREGGTDDGTRAIDVMGNLGSVGADVFPASADYAALGHIHYTTMVGGNPKVRYSGSPFCLGFDETQIERNVLLVDAMAGAVPQVKKIVVPQTYRFKRFIGTVDKIVEQITAMQSEMPRDTRPTFVEIMHDRRDGLDVRSALDEILESAPFTVVSWRQLGAASSGVYAQEEGAITARELSEEEVFRALIIAKNPDIEPDSSEMAALIDEYMPLFMEIATQVRLQAADEVL